MRVVAVAALVAGLINATGATSSTPAADVLVFAAASMKTALDDLTGPCEKATGVRIRASYAASSALARQIEEGAPAGLFIAADLEWMDYVAERKLIKPETRINLVGNRLVLIAPASQPAAMKIAPGFALAAALKGGRLAVADPAGVPAGKYARAALTTLGAWSSVESRLAPAENVRAALLLVSRGESPLGIVYNSDAIADRNVVVVDTFAEGTHPPIVYPAAVTARGGGSAAAVLDFLRGPIAGATFEKQGFTASRQR
jgi:molybdate transport system substrate-binding protein